MLNTNTTTKNASMPEVFEESTLATNEVSESKVAKEEGIFLKLEKAEKALVRTAKRLGIALSSMLTFVVLLSIVKSLCPGIETRLQPLFTLSEDFVMPVLNWVYSVTVKVLKYFVEIPVVSSILAKLASLA